MKGRSLGLIETNGYAAAVEAVDVACKAAVVSFLGYERVGMGLVTVKFSGDVGSVQAAVSAGAAAARRVGQVVSVHVIPRPHEQLSALEPGPGSGKVKKPEPPGPGKPSGGETPTKGTDPGQSIAPPSEKGPAPEASIADKGRTARSVKKKKESAGTAPLGEPEKKRTRKPGKPDKT